MDTYLDCLPTLISTRSFCSLLQTNFSLWMRALALTRKPPSREPYLSSHSCYTERKAWHTVPNPSGRLVVHPKQISPCLHTYALAHASENQMKISAQTYENSTRARGKNPLLLSQHAHIGSYPQILLILLLPDGIALTGTDGKNHSWRHWVLSWVIIFLYMRFAFAFSPTHWLIFSWRHIFI